MGPFQTENESREKHIVNPMNLIYLYPSKEKNPRRKIQLHSHSPLLDCFEANPDILLFHYNTSEYISTI
jgi:hypothetical protein